MNPTQIRDHVEASMSWKMRKTSEYVEDGAFLPLGVWGHQGWCVATIAENAREEDIRTNQYGMVTYRVPIERTTKKDTNEREVLLKAVDSARRRPKRQRSLANDDLEEEAAPPPAAARPPSSSDSESGSSHEASPSAPRSPSPRTKRAQAKAERQAKAAADKAAARAAAAAATQAKAKAKAEAKSAKALQTKAGKVYAVITRAITSMKQACRSDDILMVPEPVVAPVRSFLTVFQQHQIIARELRDGERTVWLSTLDDVPVKEAKAAERRLMACLNSLARVPR